MPFFHLFSRWQKLCAEASEREDNELWKRLVSGRPAGGMQYTRETPSSPVSRRLMRLLSRWIELAAPAAARLSTALSVSPRHNSCQIFTATFLLDSTRCAMLSAWCSSVTHRACLAVPHWSRPGPIIGRQEFITIGQKRQRMATFQLTKNSKDEWRFYTRLYSDFANIFDFRMMSYDKNSELLHCEPLKLVQSLCAITSSDVHRFQ